MGKSFIERLEDRIADIEDVLKELAGVDLSTDTPEPEVEQFNESDLESIDNSSNKANGKSA